jgi:hypothetical protein
MTIRTDTRFTWTRFDSRNEKRLYELCAPRHLLYCLAADDVVLLCTFHRLVKKATVWYILVVALFAFWFGVLYVCIAHAPLMN